MRATIVLLALGGALAACDHTPGATDGYCDSEVVNGILVTHVPGEYRCSGTKVEICSYGDDPLRDRPQWVITQDCQVIAAPDVGTCAINPATGIAQCIH